MTLRLRQTCRRHKGEGGQTCGCEGSTRPRPHHAAGSGGSRTWSDTVVVSAASRLVISPVLVVSKNPASCMRPQAQAGRAECK